MNIQIATLALFIVFIAGAYSQANGHDNITTTTNTSATVEVHGAGHRKGPIWDTKRRHGGKKAALAAVHHKKDDDKDKDKDDSDSDSDSAEKKIMNTKVYNMDITPNIIMAMPSSNSIYTRSSI